MKSYLYIHPQNSVIITVGNFVAIAMREISTQMRVHASRQREHEEIEGRKYEIIGLMDQNWLQFHSKIYIFAFSSFLFHLIGFNQSLLTIIFFKIEISSAAIILC